uniref:DNA2/NAM7 helicase-like C-terminal domain-containing protein n=1 Tax=Panagrolaimus sp. ES5 TaxID=591445 RepID=A0AC34GED5_9BILA
MEQLTELRKEATNKFGRDHGYIIQCVDNYQGEENDIIILSLVRSNNPENKIGFLKTPNRVCVALSRAKLGLYVLCNMNFLASNCGLWENIRQSAVEANAIGTKFIVKCELHQTEQKIQSFEDFGILCPEGGCTIPCNTRLDCGHSCAKPCHPDDIDHEKYLCLKRCDRKCESEYKHPCKKECYEECGNCMHLVEKKLPCNHEKLDFCYLAPVDVECVEPCELLLPCGHICGEQCGEECSIVCKKMVSRQIPGCSHLVEAECSADLSSIKCNVIVEKEWPFCKHVVKTKCSSDVSTLPCP